MDRGNDEHDVQSNLSPFLENKTGPKRSAVIRKMTSDRVLFTFHLVYYKVVYVFAFQQFPYVSSMLLAPQNATSSQAFFVHFFGSP